MYDAEQGILNIQGFYITLPCQSLFNILNFMLMPRKYNHVIRFLESWFADLEDPAKEFSDSERWQVVVALRDCQVQNSLEPLQALPLSIRRALSIPSMGEQMMAVLDRAESYKRRGKAVSSSDTPKPMPSDAMKAEIREREQAIKNDAKEKEEFELKVEREKWGALNNRELYIKQLKAAAAGDKAMREKYPSWRKLLQMVGAE